MAKSFTELTNDTATRRHGDTKDEMDRNSIVDALGRGAAQGATAGFGDELVSRILASLPGPSDPQGYGRNYAAGSEQADVQNSERASNAAAAGEHPLAYGAGSLAGGAPLAAAMPGLSAETALGRVAAGGLTGGALGGLSGAGHADGRDLGESVGRGAALGAALGTGGAAAKEAVPYVKQAMSQMSELPPTTGFAAPATAGAAGDASAVGGAQVNQAAALPAAPPAGASAAAPVTGVRPRPAMLPPRPTTGDMPNEAFVPKAAKPLTPPKPEARASMTSERPTAIEQIDPKRAYRDAAHRVRQAASARGPQPVGDDTTPTGIVPPPNAPAGGYKNTAPRGTPTIPAGYDRATMPAPTMPAPAPEMPRPTMTDLNPVKPTMRPTNDEAYKRAVLQEIAESARRNSY